MLFTDLKYWYQTEIQQIVINIIQLAQYILLIDLCCVLIQRWGSYFPYLWFSKEKKSYICDQNQIQTEHSASLHLWKWRVYFCLQKYLHPKCNSLKKGLTYLSTSTRTCSFKMLWVVMVRWALSAYVGVKCLNAAWLVRVCLVMPRIAVQAASYWKPCRDKCFPMEFAGEVTAATGCGRL